VHGCSRPGPVAADSRIPGLFTGDPGGAAIAFLHCPRDNVQGSRDIALVTGAIASLMILLIASSVLIGLIMLNGVFMFLQVIVVVLMIILLPFGGFVLFSRAFIADKRNGNIGLLGLLFAATLATMALTVMPYIFLELIY
jgi:cation transport ATPase